MSMKEAGASSASADAAPAEEGTCGETMIVPSSCPAADNLRSSWPQPLLVGVPGMTEVGEEGGSGVIGGVSAAHERRLDA
jgi:hypothetical protein